MASAGVLGGFMKFLSFFGKILLLFACLGLVQQASVDSVDAKTSQAAVKKSSKKVFKTKTPEVDPSRDIWMKRARQSEVMTGKASWYGKDFHNKKTASGVKYDMHTFTAAHRTLPLGTVVKVTDQDNGKSVMVTINDRGPFVKGRIIDLSYAAAKKLDLEDRGVSRVALEVVSDADGKPLSGERAYFVDYRSGDGKRRVGPFDAFADASAMGEALRTAHSDVDVVVAKRASK